MKKFFSFIIIFISVICLGYFLAIDTFIKVVIEREGSKALRAKLDIASATFHLLPASLTLRGVQATNPQQPTSNLLQADVVAMPLQLGELFDQKLLIDTMQIHGLRFAQPRTQSGAIDGLTPPPAETSIRTALPNPDQAHQQQIEQQQTDLQRTQQDLTALRSDWQQRLRTLPTAAQLDDYRFRAQSRDANNRARLRSELNDELAAVRKLQEQFALDIERVKPAMNYSPSSVQSGSGVQLATGAPASITGGLLGREFQPLLNHLLGFVVNAPTGETSNAEQQWQILARKVEVDGEINIGAAPLHFAGTIENITPQPRLFNVVSQFDLQGTAEQTGKFSSSGSLDYRKLPLQNARFNLSGFAVQQLPLSRDPTLQITITSALADIQGLLSLTGNQIDINVLARFQQAELALVAGDNAISRAAAETLRTTKDFDLNFQASGDVQNPQLKLNSSLDTLLAAAISRELNAQTTHSSMSSTPELAAIRQLAAEFAQMQQTLLQTQSALQTLLDR